MEIYFRMLLCDRIRISNFSLNIIYLYLIFAAFGSVLFSYIYSVVPFRLFLVAGAIKDILLFALLGIFLLLLTIYFSLNGTLEQKKLKIFMPIIFFTFFFFISAINGHASVGTIVLIFRRYYLPLLIISLFILIPLNEKKLTKFSFFIWIGVFIFGLIEYFLPISFWDDIIKLPHYWIDSGDRWAFNSVILSGRFFSFDLWFLLGHTVRRMVSSFAEPTNFSSFMISCYFIFNRNRFIKFCCFLCCCFAISKAALMIFFGLVPVLWFYSQFLKNKRYDLLYILMFIFMIFLSGLMYSLDFTVGPFSHIAGFYTGITNIFSGNIFGHGIGTVGNYSEIAERISIGGESGIGGMLASCGIGALFYVGFFYNMIKIIQRSTNNMLYILLIFAWTVICIFSESAFGASGNILFFVYSAIGVNKAMQEERCKCQN